MVWHWMLFAIIFGFTFLEFNGSIKTKKCTSFVAVLTVVLIFISSIRWNQNIADWQGYSNIFSYQRIDNFIDIFRVDYWAFEPLFFLVFRAIKFFTNDYLWVDVFIALIAIGVFFYAAKYLTTYKNVEGKEYGINKSLIIASYLVFYCTTLANIYAVRTNMSTAICMYSVKYIEKKDFKRFAITIVIAALFHFSAIVFIPAYFIYHIRLNYKIVLRVAAAFLFVRIIGISRIIGSVGILGGRYAEKALRYNIDNASSDLSYLNTSTTMLIIKAILNASVVIIIAILIRRYLSTKNIRINGFINIYVTGTLLQILTIGYNFEFSRIALYFLSMQYFLIPYVLKLKTSKISRILVFVVFSLYMTVKLYVLIGRQDGYAVFPTVFSR